MASGNSLLTAVVGIFTAWHSWDSLSRAFPDNQIIWLFQWGILLYFCTLALVIYWVRVKVPRIIPRGLDLRVAGVPEEGWVWCKGCGMDRPPHSVVAHCDQCDGCVFGRRNHCAIFGTCIHDGTAQHVVIMFGGSAILGTCMGLFYGYCAFRRSVPIPWWQCIVMSIGFF